VPGETLRHYYRETEVPLNYGVKNAL